MDDITFGNYSWHKRDCNKKRGYLESKFHTYTDGSTIEAKVFCEKSTRKKKIHVNIKLIKTNLIQDFDTFEEYEDYMESTGVCNTKN